MQAMPVINQPAVVNEAVAPRATRSNSAKSDDRFSPVLKEACSESCEDELAGAAMVVQNQEGQQKIVAENAGTEQANGRQGGAKGFVATAELIANTSIVAEPAVSSMAQAANADIGVSPSASVGGEVATAGENLTAKAVGAESILSRDTVPSDLEFTDADSQMVASLSGRRNQANPDRSDSMSAAVAIQEAIVAPTPSSVAEAQVSVAAQVAASVGEAQPLQQLNIPPLVKNVGQDVGTEKTNTKGTSSGNGVVVTDPLFATLLNKPEVGESLRQQQNLASPLVTSVASSVTTAGNENFALAQNPSVSESGVFSAPSGDPLGGAESLAVSLASNQNIDGTISTAIQPQVAIAEVGTSNVAEVTIPLRDGSSVPEGRVVQQTIDHLTLHSRGDSSSVTVRLHPEELGELQLRMVMEGDQLKVHLQAQSQQVQEVLERNFPRLRDALQDQGITVDDFQVSVDSGERSDQQFSEQREFVADMQADHFSSIDHVDEAEMGTPVVESRIDGRSVSLRV